MDVLLSKLQSQQEKKIGFHKTEFIIEYAGKFAPNNIDDTPNLNGDCSSIDVKESDLKMFC